MSSTTLDQTALSQKADEVVEAGPAHRPDVTVTSTADVDLEELAEGIEIEEQKEQQATRRVVRALFDLD